MTPDDRSAVRAVHATAILRAAIAAADPGPAVSRAVRAMPVLHRARHTHVLAIGKAGEAMAAHALAALPRGPLSSLLILPHTSVRTGRAALSSELRVLHAAHPVPDEESVHAGAEVEALLRSADDGDVVIVLLSGGASSLCVAPAAGVTIDEYAAVVRSLMLAGADIRELNTVRAHIDRLKGGGMARMIAPARAIGLIVSDVVGNPLEVIASGPLTPCSTTPHDALRILEKYGVPDAVAQSVRSALHTAREDTGSSFAHVRTEIVLDNSAAREGAAHAAAQLGYDVRVKDEPVTGIARDAGRRIARDALATARTMSVSDPPVCIVSGGETTVVVSGTGSGGRNQELVLAAAIELMRETRVTVGSIGTDGVDGPTDAAGAVADASTSAAAESAGFIAGDALRNNDSYTLLDSAHALIRTGATGTNVMDVQVVLIDPPAA
ncbi:MAG TPA: DUF4147 domain-containing protein [Longimicrobiales bacterium]|nr:DUF4147 domain-containing protein [Longimicrobiales bacterium]